MGYKIAVISDVHSNLIALNLVLREIKSKNCNEIIHLGDVISIGPNPKESLDVLLNTGAKLLMGNHEEYYITDFCNPPRHVSKGILDMVKWGINELGCEYKKTIKRFPYEYLKNINGFKILFCHYAMADKANYSSRFKDINNILNQDNIDDFFNRRNVDIIFYGHSHIFHDTHSQTSKIRYINPGSVGSYGDSFARYSIIDFEGESYNVCHEMIHYDKSELVKTVREKNIPEKEMIIKKFYGIS